MTEYKKISFRVDKDTYNRLQSYAKKEYLSLSAYIRKYLDLQITKEEEQWVNTKSNLTD